MKGIQLFGRPRRGKPRRSVAQRRGFMQSSLSFATLRGIIKRDIAHIRTTYNGEEEASEEDGEG